MTSEEASDTHSSSVQEESFHVDCLENCYFKEFAECVPVTCFAFRYRSEDFLRASEMLSNPKQHGQRCSRRKRMASDRDDEDTDPSTSKRERTTRSEDEVEFKLTVISLEAEDEDDHVADQEEMPNYVRSLTEREIMETREKIAQERVAIDDQNKRLE